MRSSLNLISLFVFTSLSALAQTASTGAIFGTVTDQNGGIVRDAKIQAEDVSRRLTIEVSTNEAGQFIFPSLEPGTYKVSASAPGFPLTVQEGVQVSITKSLRVDFRLTLGTVTQTIEVSETAGATLQTLDATTGTTVEGQALIRLPAINRSAIALLTLQPMTMPTRGAGVAPGIHLSGQIGGARSDQQTFHLDGADATDLTAGTGQYVGSATDWAGPTPMIPVPAESIAEFRVATSNPNATFGRSAGGQINLVTKRGSNEWHGSTYWYLQNDKLNANRWDNNRVGLARPPLRDNRYGASLGGPIFKNRTFFFLNYEGRRLPQTQQILRLVPTQNLRNGVLRMNTAAGVQEFNARDFDPRGIGISPVIRNYWNLFPDPNDFSVGDGLNTAGFRANADATTRSDFGVLRLDHSFTDNWRMNASYRYASQEALNTSQVDIAGLVPGGQRGVATPGGTTPVEPRFFSAAITGTLSPTLFTETIVGYARNYWAFRRTTPFPQVAGTAGALATADGTFLNQPLDVSAGAARSRQWRDNTYQLRNNTTWLKGRHTLQFGGAIRLIPVFHERNDKVVGSLTTLIYDIDARNGAVVPASSRPANLRPQDVTLWDNLFASTLGMVNRVGTLVTRDQNLNLNPLGTPVITRARMDTYDLYLADTWRVSSSLTVSLGMNYVVQQAPREANGLTTLVTEASSGRILTAKQILADRTAAANAGQTYAPTLAWVPINQSSRRTPYDTDLNNFAPRISAAWQPTFSDGFLGKLFGERKTVFRGGYSLMYDRTNGSTAIFFPPLAVGFSQSITCLGPRINGACQTGSDPTNAFRVGVDGSQVRLPVAQQLTAPIVLPGGFTEQLSMGISPDYEVGKAHVWNFTIQRELPGGIVVETGYANRLGRNLIQSVNLTSVPYFMLDAQSNQSFAQAFDNIALHLRGGGTPATAPVQPWFENQLRGSSICTPNCSVAMATRNTAAFNQGLLNQLFQFMEGQRGANPLVNNQVQELWSRASIGWSNYHAGFVSVNKRFGKGLSLTANYTLSRSWDVHGFNQEAESKMSNALRPELDYAPSFHDRTHVFNGNWYYELPFRASNPVLGNLVNGWYVGGIFTAGSGMPITVFQSTQAWGGSGVINSIAAGAIPLNPRSSYNLTVNRGVSGSGGTGTNSGGTGTGLNLFADPAAAYASFRPLEISRDGRNGRSTLRGLNRYNTDLSLGKRIRINEKVNALLTGDFFNAFNRVEFMDPSFNPGNNTQTNLQNRANFGVLSTQFGTPRQIQLGLRIEF
jgi:hypothetical protein